MSISEAVKALVSPCEKLIEALQSAIGKAYDPRYVRKMADAKAYEIKRISMALSESSDIPIVYDKGDFSMDTTDFDQLVKRTQNRLAFQELRKQANIEAVLSNAYNNLLEEPKVSDEPIDQDWLIRFFNSVEDISNEQMQRLWGKLLAGETMKPRTFSIRTLNILKNLTHSEAELFKRVSPYVLSCPGNDKKSFLDYYLPHPLSNVSLLEKNNIFFPEIMILNEAGIISQNAFISVAMHLEPKETDWIVGSQAKIECYNGGDSPIRLSSSAFILTEAGKELFPIICDCEAEIPLDYYNDYMNCILDDNQLRGNSQITVSVVESKR